MATGLELMLMISALTPSFFNNPFSCTIQIGVASGLIPVQPILAFSCALAESESVIGLLMVSTMTRIICFYASYSI